MSEPQLIEELRKYDMSKRLIDQVRLNNPGRLVLSAWISDVSPLLGPGSEKVLDGIAREIGYKLGEEVYVNYYVDKRERKLNLPRSSRPVLFDDDDLPVDGAIAQAASPEPEGPSGIVGVISLPARWSGSGEVGQDGPMPKKHLDLDDAARVLASYFGAHPDAISSKWIGGRRHARSYHGQLFSDACDDA